jgi:hypothetical protein
MAQHSVPEQLRNAVVADLVSRIAELGRERPEGADDALIILRSLPEIDEDVELEVVWSANGHPAASVTLSLNAQALVLSFADEEGSHEIYSCDAGFYPAPDRDDLSAWLMHFRQLDCPDVTISIW